MRYIFNPNYLIFSIKRNQDEKIKGYFSFRCPVILDVGLEEIANLLKGNGLHTNAMYCMKLIPDRSQRQTNIQVEMYFWIKFFNYFIIYFFYIIYYNLWLFLGVDRRYEY